MPTTGVECLNPMCWTIYCQKIPTAGTASELGNNDREKREKGEPITSATVEIDTETETPVCDNHTPAATPAPGESEESNSLDKKDDYTVASINSFKGQKKSAVNINKGDSSSSVAQRTPTKDPKGPPPTDFWSGLCRLQDFVCFTNVDTIENVNNNPEEEQRRNIEERINGSQKLKTGLPQLGYYKV